MLSTSPPVTYDTVLVPVTRMFWAATRPSGIVNVIWYATRPSPQSIDDSSKSKTRPCT